VQALDGVGRPGRLPLRRVEAVEGEQPVAGFLEAAGDCRALQLPLAQEGPAALRSPPSSRRRPCRGSPRSARRAASSARGRAGCGACAPCSAGPAPRATARRAPPMIVPSWARGPRAARPVRGLQAVLAHQAAHPLLRRPQAGVAQPGPDLAVALAVEGALRERSLAAAQNRRHVGRSHLPFPSIAMLISSSRASRRAASRRRSATGSSWPTLILMR
jgi:hypothetical protein